MSPLYLIGERPTYLPRTVVDQREFAEALRSPYIEEPTVEYATGWRLALTWTLAGAGSVLTLWCAANAVIGLVRLVKTAVCAWGWL